MKDDQLWSVFERDGISTSSWVVISAKRRIRIMTLYVLIADIVLTISFDLWRFAPLFLSINISGYVRLARVILFFWFEYLVLVFRMGKWLPIEPSFILKECRSPHCMTEIGKVLIDISYRQHSRSIRCRAVPKTHALSHWGIWIRCRRSSWCAYKTSLAAQR